MRWGFWILPVLSPFSCTALHHKGVKLKCILHTSSSSLVLVALSLIPASFFFATGMPVHPVRWPGGALRWCAPGRRCPGRGLAAGPGAHRLPVAPLRPWCVPGCFVVQYGFCIFCHSFLFFFCFFGDLGKRCKNSKTANSAGTQRNGTPSGTG